MTQGVSGITIDVESDWGGRHPPRADTLRGCEVGLPLILDTLKSRGLKATFFVSGRVAEVAPEFVSMIVAGGHEVASHGYDHIDYLKLEQRQLQYQLQKSKDILQVHSQLPVRGFRTPQFKVPKQLFSSLSSAGYVYDSSVVLGSLRGRYKNSLITVAKAEKAGIVEIPLRTIPVIGIPVGLLWILKIGVTSATSLMRLKGRAGPECPMDYILYCHPFDFLDWPNKSTGQNLLVRLWYNWPWGSPKRGFEKSVDFLAKHYSVINLAAVVQEGKEFAPG